MAVRLFGLSGIRAFTQGLSAAVPICPGKRIRMYFTRSAVVQMEFPVYSGSVICPALLQAFSRVRQILPQSICFGGNSRTISSVV